MADEPVQLFLSDVRRVDRVVRRVEADPESLVGEGGPGGLRPSRGRERVKITAATRDGTNWRWTYTGQVQIRNTGAFSDWSNAPRFTGTIELQNTYEENGYAGIACVPNGAVVDAWYERFTSGGSDSVRWCFSIPNAKEGASFAVKVTKDGGSAGTPTAAASWLYTVKTLSGDTLGTGVAPQRARSIGITNAAPDDSYGLAAYTNSGTLVLLDVFGEYRGKATC